MGIYVGLSLLVLLLLFLWFWARASAGRADVEVGRWGDLGVGRSGLTRRSFVGLGAALGVTIGVFGRGGLLRSGVATHSELVPVAPCASRRAFRAILPMSSGSNVLPNASMQIVSRPQILAFRPDRMLIANSGDWWIEDITIGGIPQFNDADGVPGSLFGASTADPVLFSSSAGPSAGPTGDISIRARYTGSSAQGAPFVCSIVGDSIVGDSIS